MSTDNSTSLRAKLLAEATSPPENGEGAQRDAIGDAGRFPSIMEVLSPWCCPKGVRGGRIGIYINNDRLNVCLSWPEVGKIAFINIEELGDLLQVVESRLSDGLVKWLPDKKLGRK